MHRAILDQVRALGYAVSEHRVNSTVELHAVLLADPDCQYISRSADGEGDDEAYSAACLLAGMVGIDLTDGRTCRTGWRGGGRTE